MADEAQAGIDWTNDEAVVRGGVPTTWCRYSNLAQKHKITVEESHYAGTDLGYLWNLIRTQHPSVVAFEREYRPSVAEGGLPEVPLVRTEDDINTYAIRWHKWATAATSEIARLREGLLKANVNTEEYERKFYLASDRAEAAETALATSNEWKNSIQGLLFALGMKEEMAGSWRGDIEGWGAAFEWIKYHVKRSQTRDTIATAGGLHEFN